MAGHGGRQPAVPLKTTQVEAAPWQVCAQVPPRWACIGPETPGGRTPSSGLLSTTPPPLRDVGPLDPHQQQLNKNDDPAHAPRPVTSINSGQVGEPADLRS